MKVVIERASEFSLVASSRASNMTIHLISRKHDIQMSLRYENLANKTIFSTENVKNCCVSMVDVPNIAPLRLQKDTQFSLRFTTRVVTSVITSKIKYHFVVA